MASTDPKTAALLSFREVDTDILPSDRAGNLEPLSADVANGLAMPTVGDGLIDRGRVFDGASGLVTVEAEAGSLELRRDLTIDVVLHYDIAAAAGTGVVAQRGRSTGAAAEVALFGLQLEKVSATVATLRMRWDYTDALGAYVAATVPGVKFTVPAGHFYAWAIRRWKGPAAVEVIYGLNDQEIGRVTSVHGDIRDGTGGAFQVGCRDDGTGSAYANHFRGTIDELRVSNVARTVEEMRQTFRAFAVHQPRGAEIVRALVPPRVYSTDPDSAVQRELAIEGDALGAVMATVAAIREDTLPDRAWFSLEDWERICRLHPKPGARVEERRAEVVSFLRTVHGFNVDKVPIALQDVFDLDPSDIQIVEGTNRFVDDFSADKGWWQNVLGEAGAHSIALQDQDVSGSTETVRVSATDDARWRALEYVARRVPIPAGDLLRDSGPYDGAQAQVQIQAASIGVTSVYGGLMAWNAAGDLIIVGVDFLAAQNRLVVQTYDAASDTWTTAAVLENPVTLPSWVRLEYVSGSDWRVYFDTSADPTANETAVTGPADPVYVGLGIASPGTWVGTQTIDFRDFELWAPLALLPFLWFAYRDPGLAGTPNMRAAERLVQRLKPAHTEGHAVVQLDAEADDTSTICDITPLEMSDL